MTTINDEIYVDLLLSNTIQSQANQRVPITFNQSSSQPILYSTNGYQLSIIRFSLNTETLPIFIPQMLPNSDSNTVYNVTLEYNGVHYQQPMQFIPQNINPVDNDEYFYVYSYQYVIYLFNNCIQQCYNSLSQLTTLPNMSLVPTMTIDNETKICSLSIDDAYYGYNETNKINIYFNLSMYSLFASLPAITINRGGGIDYQLNNLISSNKSILTQDYTTTPLWNPVSSVVFLTSLLPIYQSQTPPIQIYQDGKLQPTSSSYKTNIVVTDFIGNDLQFTPFIQYASDVYRFLSLKPNSQIRDIDLSVYWINKNTGQSKPVYLSVGASCSVKIYITKM